MQTGLVVLVGFLVVATLIPWSRSERWWVRGWDFPRLQLTCFALLLLIGASLLSLWKEPFGWALMSIILLCLAAQAWWILPYTRLFPREVERAAEAGGVERRGSRSRLRVISANVLMSNRDSTKLLALVRRERPHVLVALETDLWWQRELDVLKGEYPYTVQCPQENFYGMLVYSRLPLEEVEVSYLVNPEIPSMHMQVVLEAGERIRLHCLHPEPPTPTANPESGERDAELVAVGRSVARSRQPVVVTGDLNDVAWSETTRLFRKISGLLDPRVGRGFFNTFHAHKPFFRWPLDHLFHSRHFCLVEMRRLEEVGSDHFPILVELELCHVEEAEERGLEADTEDQQWAEEKLEENGASEEAVPTPGE